MEMVINIFQIISDPTPARAVPIIPSHSVRIAVAATLIAAPTRIRTAAARSLPVMVMIANGDPVPAIITWPINKTCNAGTPTIKLSPKE